MIVHDGESIPKDPRKWDPDDTDIVWISWAKVLNGSSITASAWILESNWTELETFENQAVTDAAGRSHPASNGVRLSTSETYGEFTVTNRCTLADGRRLDRSVKIQVEAQ